MLVKAEEAYQKLRILKSVERGAAQLGLRLEQSQTAAVYHNNAKAIRDSCVEHVMEGIKNGEHEEIIFQRIRDTAEYSRKI